MPYFRIGYVHSGAGDRLSRCGAICGANMAGYCLNCAKPKTGQALCCGNSCRSAIRRLRLRLEALPPTIGRLFDQLCDFAPAQATGYRLHYCDTDGRWVYPRIDGHQWLSFDRGITQRRAFGLRPFEIPSVDRPGLFGVQFLSRGRVYDTPIHLLSGVYVVPVLAAPSPGQRLI